MGGYQSYYNTSEITDYFKMFQSQWFTRLAYGVPVREYFLCQVDIWFANSYKV